MNDIQDIGLFEATKNGDKKALSSLYLKYYDHLIHYGVRLTPDQYIVEECTQEMFLYIYEARTKLGIVKNVKAYLFSSIRRRVLEKIKIERDLNISSTSNNYRTNIQFAMGELQYTEGMDQDKIAAMSKELNRLPWRQREAIYLRYYNRLTTNEIAEVMGAANQTVLNTLYFAIKKLRKSLVNKNLLP